MSNPEFRVPSADLDALFDQLLREVDTLVASEAGAAGAPGSDGAAQAEAAANADPWRFKVHLQKILSVAWNAVAHGDLGALAGLARRLVRVEDRTRARLPEPETPLREAARDVNQLMRSLLLGDSCLDLPRLEERLADRQRSRTERAVMRCLRQRMGEYLRRGEIRDILAQTGAATVEASRVGQILVELHRQGLVLRVSAAAQGNPDTAHYTLSSAGRALCDRLPPEPLPADLFERSAAVWGPLLDGFAAEFGAGAGSTRSGITAFYAQRPGLGRSTAVALCAQHMAETARENSRFCAIDLDTDFQDLSCYLGPVSESCRGLLGLMRDYGRQDPNRCRPWLADAVLDQDYSWQLPAASPNLWLLPSGVPPGSLAARSDLLEGLTREAAAQPRGAGGAPLPACRGFLGDLREVLINRFVRTLIDVPSTLDAACYASVFLVSGGLVLFLRYDENTFGPSRTILGHFLWRCAATGVQAPGGDDTPSRAAGRVTLVQALLPVCADAHGATADGLAMGLSATLRRGPFMPLYQRPELVAKAGSAGRLKPAGRFSPEESAFGAGIRVLATSLYGGLGAQRWRREQSVIDEAAITEMVDLRAGKDITAVLKEIGADEENFGSMQQTGAPLVSEGRRRPLGRGPTLRVLGSASGLQESIAEAEKPLFDLVRQ
jgi:hypothetical protein